MGLIVTRLTVSADKLKQNPQALQSFSPTNGPLQKSSDELKPDFIPIYLYARENSLDGDYNFR